MLSWAETLDSFRTARESWDLLHSHDALENGKKKTSDVAMKTTICDLVFSLNWCDFL